MKKKRIISLLLCLALAFSLLSSVALADGGEPRDCGDVFRFAQMLVLEGMVSAANAKVESMTACAKLTPYDDVDWLLWHVEATVRPVFAYAAAIGARVVCDYEMHYIDGRWVAIDPIRIIK